MIKYRTGYGVGDTLLATGVIKALQRRKHKKIIIETRYPELFLYNPDVYAIWQDGRITSAIQDLFGHRGIWRLGNFCLNLYRRYEHMLSYPFPCSRQHLIDAMAASVAIELLPEERRPFFYLSQAELETQSWVQGWVVVQSSSTTYWTSNKSWVPGRMQSVVDELKSQKYKVVQLGVIEDEPLQGVTDLRGKTTLRQGAAVLANARLFIGMEGGLIHTARAVNTPCVVIYTGYTTPEETGYPENVNLRAAFAGDGCWLRTPCEHCRASANAIGVEQVLEAMNFILANQALSNDKNYLKADIH